MYKNKDKQREANAERQRRYKAKQKALLSEGVTGKALPECDWPICPCAGVDSECPIPEDQRKPYINYGPYMTAHQLSTAGLKFNRVSKPGDADYNGICTDERRAERGC